MKAPFPISQLAARALSLTLGFGALLGIPSTLEAQTPSPSSKYEITLLEKQWAPAAGLDQAMLDRIAGRAKSNDKIHFLVQLYDLPDEAKRNDLERRGLALADYATGNAFMAALPATQAAALASFSEVRWAMPWSAEHKTHPLVKAHDFGAWTRAKERPDFVMLFVQLHRDVELERIFKIADAVGGAAMEPIEGLHGATVWLPEGNVQTLAEIEDVLWIEEGPMPLSATNDGVRAGANIDPVLSAPYNLDGSGVRLFVYDSGTVRASHETFDAGSGSRVTVLDGVGAQNHSTHVAGTAAGDGSGSSGGRGRGIATAATILSSAFQPTGGTMLFWDNTGDIQADYALARVSHQADLGNNSIGANIAYNGFPCSREGDYGLSSNLVDGIVRGNNAAVGSAMIMVWANGNERSNPGRCGANYATTGPPACAKNPIHVGAINSDGSSMTDFSSWGPCDDGRLKPIVSAPGCEQGRVTGENYVYSSFANSDSAYGGPGYCGTSMASPAVSGIVSLFLEDWRSRSSLLKNSRPLPALVKAFLIHTARDLGQPGPDFIYGYGAVDAKAMIDTLRAGTGSLATSSAPVVWGTGSIANGAVNSYHYVVAAGTTELKASLAWDDAAAAAYAANALVNDLTLQLISPSGVVYNSYVLSKTSPHREAYAGLNTVDNQEQVVVKNPQAGGWTVRVTGTSVPVGPQSFGLVYSSKSADYDPATCASALADFETGNDSFTLSGASRVAAPATGHGAYSLQLGGTVSTTDEAYRDIAIPAGSTRAALTYYVWESTSETAAGGFGRDYLTVEVRDTAGNVLAVIDNRNDGWKTGTWMRQFEVDLTAWQGTTVRLAFRATNSVINPTTFWIDDFKLETCQP